MEGLGDDGDRRWVCGVMLTMALSGCREAVFPTPPADALRSVDGIEIGTQLFVRNCGICHGATGRGDGPQAWSLDPRPSSFQQLTGRRGDPGYWFFRIKEGGHAEPLARRGSAMPAWGNHLSDEQIWQLVAYLTTLAGGDR